MGGLASQFASMATSGVADQMKQQAAMQAHYAQLGAAAKCPNCGATAFTQQQGADVPDSQVAPSQPPPAATAPQAPAVQIFVLNEKLISLTQDLWIEDDKGNHMFEVDGSLLSLHGTHVLKDANGQTLYEISKPLAPHVHKTIEIKKDGQTIATVQEAILHFGGDKFQISVAGGLQLTVHGNWSNRQFQVNDQAGRQVLEASRAWFSMRGAYGIQITPGFDVPLGLAIVVALERVEAQEQGQESPIQNLLGGIGPF